MMCKTILELVSSPLLAEMAPPMARGAAAAISADQTGSSHGQMGSSSPPSVGGAPFAVCPMCSWEQLWFLVVHNTDKHLRRYDCTTSTCNGTGHKMR